MTALSIITICRNDRSGLKRTIDSVLSQTLPPTEFIIVDGASTDGTSEWLAANEWPAYMTWASEPDDGIYDAMNKGMRRLRERGLVMFLNAGDSLKAPATLSSISASHEAHGWLWAAGSAIVVDAAGRPVREMLPRSPSRPLFMLGLAPIPHQAAVFTVTLLEELGPYDARAGTAADTLYMLRCWLHAAPFALGMVVAYYDSTGISGRVRPWFGTWQMRAYRVELGIPLLGSNSADLGLTMIAMATATIATLVQPQARLRSLITVFRRRGQASLRPRV